MDYYHEYFRIEHERLSVKAGNLRTELTGLDLVGVGADPETEKKLQEDVAWVEAARNAMRGRL